RTLSKQTLQEGTVSAKNNFMNSIGAIADTGPVRGNCPSYFFSASVLRDHNHVVRVRVTFSKWVLTTIVSVHLVAAVLDIDNAQSLLCTLNSSSDLQEPLPVFFLFQKGCCTRGSPNTVHASRLGLNESICQQHSTRSLYYLSLGSSTRLEDVH